MRISDLGVFQRYLNYDRVQQGKIQKYSNQLSSGKKILIPSDAAIDNARVLRLKSIVSETDGYLRNMDIVQTTQEIAENTLSNIINAADESRVDFLQLLNTGVLDAEDARIFKDYFSSMRDYILKQANMKEGDSFIFSGIKSQSEPFNQYGYYQGAFEETKVPIAPATQVRSTFNGDRVLATVESGIYTNGKVGHKIGLVKALDDIVALIDDGDLRKLHGKNSALGYVNTTDALISSTETEGELKVHYGTKTFIVPYDADTTDNTKPSTLQEIVDAFNSPTTNPGNFVDGKQQVVAYTFKDRDGIYRLGFYGSDSKQKLSIEITGDLAKHLGNFQSTLELFDASFSETDRQRSVIGTEMKLLDDLRDQHETYKVNYKELISKLEDADYAESIVKLQEAKTAYEATMATYIQNKDLSLLKYFK